MTFTLHIIYPQDDVTVTLPHVESHTVTTLIGMLGPVRSSSIRLAPDDCWVADDVISVDRSCMI